MIDTRFPHLDTYEQAMALRDPGNMVNVREVFAVVRALHAQAASERDTDPQRSDRLREDIAYRMGVVDGLERVLRLPAEALAILEQLAAKERGRT